MTGRREAIINANEVITASPTQEGLTVVPRGAVVFEAETIIAVGPTEKLLREYTPVRTYDASNQVVMPGMVDPHTHLPYIGSRHQEYEYKISGSSYTELHQSGGIRFTVAQTREADEETLLTHVLKDLDIMLRHGTTTVEAKSGYGLSYEQELKLLRVIKKANALHPVTLVATFLGAHTVPEEFLDNRSKYVDVVKQLLPEAQRYAEFCDVWCDPLGFTLEETRDILTAAQELGFKLKVHAEQTADYGGAALLAQMKGVSADHLDFLSTAGIEALQANGTIPVLLPGVTYHLMEFNKEFPLTAMRAAGLPLALATDYNPGSCRTQSMQTIMEMACRLYKFSYAEALRGATLHAAAAIDRASTHGSLEPGKTADIVICDCQFHGELLNSFGVNLVDRVFKDGKLLVAGGILLHDSRQN